MRIQYLGILLITTIIFGLQCSDSSILFSVDAELGETVEISYNQVIRIESENLYFGLTDQILESRCPANAYCFWEGQVSAQFWFTKNQTDTLMSTALHSPSGSYDKDAEIPCYSLIIESVAPYPQDYVVIPFEQYRVRARVERQDCSDTMSEIKPVQFSTLPPDQLQKSTFQLNDVTILSDTITLDISYSGGCHSHDLVLYMTPTFLESYPVQASLYLYHNDFNDPCDAWLTRSISFNVEQIAKLYKSHYGEYDDIILNVYRYFDNIPTGKISVTYTP